jgi:hypothetical protein
MNVSYNTIAAHVKVEISLDDLTPRHRADLLTALMDKSGLMELVLEQGKKDENFARRIDLAFQTFSERWSS